MDKETADILIPRLRATTENVYFKEVLEEFERRVFSITAVPKEAFEKLK